MKKGFIYSCCVCVYIRIELAVMHMLPFVCVEIPLPHTVNSSHPMLFTNIRSFSLQMLREGQRTCCEGSSVPCCRCLSRNRTLLCTGCAWRDGCAYESVCVSDLTKAPLWFRSSDCAKNVYLFLFLSKSVV